MADKANSNRVRRAISQIIDSILLHWLLSGGEVDKPSLAVETIARFEATRPDMVDWVTENAVRDLVERQILACLARVEGTLKIPGTRRAKRTRLMIEIPNANGHGFASKYVLDVAYVEWQRREGYTQHGARAWAEKDGLNRDVVAFFRRKRAKPDATLRGQRGVRVEMDKAV